MKKEEFVKRLFQYPPSKKIAGELFDELTAKTAKCAFEFDQEGNHRIIVNGVESDWHGYQFLASATVQGKLYVGATQYYDGVMPVEQVLEITALETKFRRVVVKKGEPKKGGAR